MATQRSTAAYSLRPAGKDFSFFSFVIILFFPLFSPLLRPVTDLPGESHARYIINLTKILLLANGFFSVVYKKKNLPTTVGCCAGDGDTNV